MYHTRPVVTAAARTSRSPTARFVAAINAIGAAMPPGLRRALCADEASTRNCGAIDGMMVESFERSPDDESAVVAALCAGYRDAKAAQRDAPPVYQPGEEWRRLLESQWSRYRDAIDREDVGAVAALLRNFFRNEGLSGFWGGERMFESFAALDGRKSLQRAAMMQRQYDAWRANSPDAEIAELAAPPIGNPWGYVIRGTLLYEPVFEYHFQARHFATLLTHVARPIVVEIGGGFGGLAYHVLSRLPRATYVGFDLPENVFLQGYYLSCAFPDRKILVYRRGMAALTREDVAAHDIVLLPNFMIPALPDSVADLVANVRSLSEMPVDTIREYLGQIDRIGRLFFFHENIHKPRGDGLYGTPSSRFPDLRHHVLLCSAESRWPRYADDSAYPCRENLYIHETAIRRSVEPG